MSLKRSLSSNDLIEAKVVKSDLEAEIKSAPTCDPESVKDSLTKIISVHTVNSGDFATGFLLSDEELSVLPLIGIKEYGILPVPINKSIFMEMKQFFEEPLHGLGEKSMLEKLARNCIQMEPSRFTITNEKFVIRLKALLETKIKDELGLVGSNISAEPYKLFVYEKGGKIETHIIDTAKECDNTIGTMIVQLPSIFTGGDLVVTHNRKKRTFKNSEGSSTHCKVVAHYSSCLHELQEITSGYRVTLVYSLCWDGNGIKPSPYIASTNSVRLCNLMNKYLDSPDVPFICWSLDSEYSDLSIINGNLISSLKGSDKKLVKGFLNSIAHDIEQSGSDRFEVYIATAKRKTRDHYRYCEICKYEYDYCCCKQYYLKDFTPVLDSSAKINNNIKIIFDEEGDNNMLFDKDCGSKHDDGCSSENEKTTPTTHERWNKTGKIQVLVMWKKEDAIPLMCRSDLTPVIEHVYSLHDGKIEESVEGLKVLMTHLDKFTQDNLYKTVEICCEVKACDETLNLIAKLTNQMKDNDHHYDDGIVISESRALIISKVVGTFTWDVTKDAVLSLLKRCPTKQVKHVIYCCNLIDLDIITTLKILVDQLAEEYRKRKEKKYYYGCNYLGEAYKHIVCYALDKNTFPSELMENFLKDLEEFEMLYSLIEIVLLKSNGDLFLMSLVSHFVDMVFTKPRPMLELWIGNVSKVIKLLHCHNKEDGLNKIIDCIIALPSNQDMLKNIVAHISSESENKENLPASLILACKKRLIHLEGLAQGGEPQFSWKQPTATVPDHPMVEKFLRSSNQRFTYRNFTSAREAREWASKHMSDSGCFMKITTGGVSEKAYAKIAKTKAGYNEAVKIFKEIMSEYNRLIKVVPDYSDATLIDSVQPIVSTVNNNGVTSIVDYLQRPVSVSTGNKTTSLHKVITID